MDEGYARAVNVVRAALDRALAEPRPPRVPCRCGRAQLASERAGRITALGNVLAALIEATPGGEGDGRA